MAEQVFRSTRADFALFEVPDPVLPSEPGPWAMRGHQLIETEQGYTFVWFWERVDG